VASYESTFLYNRTVPDNHRPTPYGGITTVSAKSCFLSKLLFGSGLALPTLKGESDGPPH